MSTLKQITDEPYVIGDIYIKISYLCFNQLSLWQEDKYLSLIAKTSHNAQHWTHPYLLGTAWVLGRGKTNSLLFHTPTPSIEPPIEGMKCMKQQVKLYKAAGHHIQSVSPIPRDKQPQKMTWRYMHVFRVCRRTCVQPEHQHCNPRSL